MRRGSVNSAFGDSDRAVHDRAKVVGGNRMPKRHQAPAERRDTKSYDRICGDVVGGSGNGEGAGPHPNDRRRKSGDLCVAAK